MQEVQYSDNLFIPKNFKYVQVNKTANKENAFMNCLRKASNLLNSLEKSFEKSNKYEEKLSLCRKSHSHCHPHKLWDSEGSDSKEVTNSTAEQNNLCKKYPSEVTQSWSTMSIVCLQYQYDELSKRYESLLRAYDERCSALNHKDTALDRLRKRINKAQLEVAYLHNTILAVGEKYLTLKCKKLEQKNWYNERIETLISVIYEILVIAERARLKLDQQLSERMATEHDAAVFLLLAEIKKCNYLFLENLRLKCKIDSVEQ